MTDWKIVLRNVEAPQKDGPDILPMLTDKTMQKRKEKVMAAMHQRGLQQLIVYGDVEHGGNFEYLVGFFTRFEEALLVISENGLMTLMLGNENLNKASKARLEAKAVHVSLFSLPNQPNRHDKTFKALLIEAGIRPEHKIGIAGWKLFTGSLGKQMFDLPAFIVDSLREIVMDDANLINATDIFIGENGVRTTNNANEIAHYEYGAALASDCLLDAMNAIQLGVQETALGDKLVRYGQHTSVVTIAASGPRFIQGNMFPTAKNVALGDTIALTVGYRGGLSSRAGYAVTTAEQLPSGSQDYLSKAVIPYFKAYVCWLQTMKVGIFGQAVFNRMEDVLPRSVYGWTLCPGHLTAEEEWLSSPIYEHSTELLKSGMIFQIDIIPSIAGYGGVSAESTVVLADEKLRREISEQYPLLWQRMQNRLRYLKNVLGIDISKDLLPMCSTVAYLRPYLLDQTKALTVESQSDD